MSPLIIVTSVCVCVCVCVCVFMWVCVLHDNSKTNRSRNMKFKYFVVNENNLDKLDNGHCQTKVKVTIQLFEIFWSHNSTLVQARKLPLSVYVNLIIAYKFYKYRHA